MGNKKESTLAVHGGRFVTDFYFV